MTSVARRSWAFMRVDDSACGGNLGCADRDGQWYAYDSDVPGNKLVREGDFAVIVGRDGTSGTKYPIGYAIVGEVMATPGTKTMQRCPT
jgi:hypothetical protein